MSRQAHVERGCIRGPEEESLDHEHRGIVPIDAGFLFDAFADETGKIEHSGVSLVIVEPQQLVESLRRGNVYVAGVFQSGQVGVGSEVEPPKGVERGDVHLPGHGVGEHPLERVVNGGEALFQGQQSGRSRLGYQNAAGVKFGLGNAVVFLGVEQISGAAPPEGLPGP